MPKFYENTDLRCSKFAVKRERSKKAVGIPECCEEIGKNMCNPILQAKQLNAGKPDLNVVIGLCVGHDSLFNKYSDALVTTLLTKDRVPGHSAAAALYLRKDILFKTDMQLICKGLSAKACKNEMGDTALLCGIPILI